MRWTLVPLAFGCMATALAGKPQAEQGTVSVIVVGTEAQALELRRQVLSGASFEALAMLHSLDPSSPRGGYFGPPSDGLRAVFKLLEPGAVSEINRAGDRYVLLKRSTSSEDDWRSLHESGVEALRSGQLAEAVSLLLTAVAKAEEFGTEDVRLADSLNGLARAYRYSARYDDAEKCARRALAIHEKVLGREHSGNIDSLVNLAAAANADQLYSEAASLYGRILSIRWKGPGDSGTPGAYEVLDGFGELLSVAHTRGETLGTARERFRELVTASSLGRDLYGAMRDGLMSATLIEDAEFVMQRATEVHPDSRQVRFQQAEFYVKTERYRRALEILEETSRMTRHPDPPVDRVQRSAIFQRIAETNIFMVRFDPALEAVRTAVNEDSSNVAARLVLADLYLRKNRLDEAAAEYRRAASDGRSADAYYGLAQVALSLGRFAEAAGYAAQSLEVDPGHRRSRYVRAMALIREGRSDEGREALDEYERLEAAAARTDSQKREAAAIERRATALLLAGRLEDASGVLREGVRLYPSVRVLHLKLGLVQGRLGLHREAVETFRGMIRFGLDDFLVHRSLSSQYEQLGDAFLGDRHRAISLQKLDAALNEKVGR